MLLNGNHMSKVISKHHLLQNRLIIQCRYCCCSPMQTRANYFCGSSLNSPKCILMNNIFGCFYSIGRTYQIVVFSFVVTFYFLNNIPVDTLAGRKMTEDSNAASSQLPSWRIAEAPSSKTRIWNHLSLTVLKKWWSLLGSIVHPSVH